MPYDDLYEKHGNRTGIDAAYIKRVAQIENSERAGGCTGSYCGIMQLSESEFRRGGGTGSRFDPEQSIMAATNIWQQQALAFKEKYGRDPTHGERYLMHNQGVGGLDAHMANPDRPAWQNMYSTGEGQKKGQGWSKLAVRLNTPGGGGENITSQEFMDRWDKKFTGVETAQHEPTGMPQQAEEMGEHEMAGLPTEEIGEKDRETGGKMVSGRGAADVAQQSMLGELLDAEQEMKGPVSKLQIPKLNPSFNYPA